MSGKRGWMNRKRGMSSGKRGWMSGQRGMRSGKYVRNEIRDGTKEVRRWVKRSAWKRRM